MDKTAIRVLVVDDHAIVRRGIRALLAENEHIEVVGEASDGQEAVTRADALSPDVVLMDLVMPGLDGIEATRQITADEAGPRILVLTSFAGDDMVFPAIKAGALGYLLKDSEPADLVEAIQQVHRGEPSLQPSIAQKVLKELRRPSARPPTPNPLTDREREVLRLVAKGLTNKAIGRALDISDRTVQGHLANIYGKLNASSRTEAVTKALRQGWLTIE